MPSPAPASLREAKQVCKAKSAGHVGSGIFCMSENDTVFKICDVPMPPVADPSKDPTQTLTLALLPTHKACSAPYALWVYMHIGQAHFWPQTILHYLTKTRSLMARQQLLLGISTLESWAHTFNAPSWKILIRKRRQLTSRTHPNALPSESKRSLVLAMLISLRLSKTLKVLSTDHIPQKHMTFTSLLFPSSILHSGTKLRVLCAHQSLNSDFITTNDWHTECLIFLVFICCVMKNSNSVPVPALESLIRWPLWHSLSSKLSQSSSIVSWPYLVLKPAHRHAKWQQALCAAKCLLACIACMVTVGGVLHGQASQIGLYLRTVL